MAQEFNRAHILGALESKVPEPQIMVVLNVCRTAIWRTHATYLQGGLDFALYDEARPGEPSDTRQLWKRRWCAGRSAQLLDLLMQANHRLVYVIAASIQIQQVAHAPAVLCGQFESITACTEFSGPVDPARWLRNPR
jgi:hypothetical protein